jgi:hypothetical protein
MGCSTRVLRSHTKRKSDPNLKNIKQTDIHDVKREHTDDTRPKSENGGRKNARTKHITAKPSPPPIATLRRLKAGTSTSKRSLLVRSSANHTSKKKYELAPADTPPRDLNTPTSLSTDGQCAVMGPPLFRPRAAGQSNVIPKTPARSSTSDSSAVPMFATPISRSTDTKQSVSGLQATPKNTVRRNIDYAANLRNYGITSVTENANLIDAIYPQLEQRPSAEKVLQDNYTNGKWKGWPATPNEKMVFEWLQNLGTAIKKADSLDGEKRDAGQSRIINHGVHRISGKFNCLPLLPSLTL